MKKREIVCKSIATGKTRKSKIDELNFRPGVYAIVIRNNKVLLLPQWDGYDFPGGGIDLGESVKEAFSRELWEETGLTGSMDKTVHIETEFRYDHKKDKVFHAINIYGTCKNLKGNISTSNFDEDEKEYAKKAQWIPVSKIKKIKFINATDSVKLIRKAIALK